MKKPKVLLEIKKNISSTGEVTYEAVPHKNFDKGTNIQKLNDIDIMMEDLENGMAKYILTLGEYLAGIQFIYEEAGRVYCAEHANSIEARALSIVRQLKHWSFINVINQRETLPSDVASKKIGSSKEKRIEIADKAIEALSNMISEGRAPSDPKEFLRYFARSVVDTTIAELHAIKDDGKERIVI